MSDPRRTTLLQIRVPPEDLEEIRRLASEAGQDMSAWVLDRLLPGRERVDGRASRWGEARELANRLAPGDRLTAVELGSLRSTLAIVLRSQGLDLREDADGIEVVRAP